MYTPRIVSSLVVWAFVSDARQARPVKRMGNISMRRVKIGRRKRKHQDNCF
jgi:hypothetical protein